MVFRLVIQLLITTVGRGRRTWTLLGQCTRWRPRIRPRMWPGRRRQPWLPLPWHSNHPIPDTLRLCYGLPPEFFSMRIATAGPIVIMPTLEMGSAHFTAILMDIRYKQNGLVLLVKRRCFGYLKLL